MTKFYDRKEIKDAIAYLSVIANPNDSVRLSRIINEPKRGIGESSLTTLIDISTDLGLDILEVMKTSDDYPKLSRASKKLKAFAEMLEGFIELSEKECISDLQSLQLFRRHLQSSSEYSEFPQCLHILSKCSSIRTVYLLSSLKLR